MVDGVRPLASRLKTAPFYTDDRGQKQQQAWAEKVEQPSLEQTFAGWNLAPSDFKAKGGHSTSSAGPTARMDRREQYEDPTAVSCTFTAGFILSQLLGLICIALVATWTGKYLGGFAWTSSPEHEFNYHPLLMVIGMVYLYGDAIMVYRVLRYERKKILKYIHAALHFLIFILIVIALVAVFEFHNARNIKNMYSLHSWIGLTTVILFCVQYVFGFAAFLFPGVARAYRIAAKPYHVFFGVGLFIMAVATCLLGITEKLLFVDTKYSSLDERAVIGNILGVFITMFALLVVYLVATPKFQRQPLPEEEVLQLENHSSVN